MEKIKRIPDLSVDEKKAHERYSGKRLKKQRYRAKDALFRQPERM